jgi:phenylalanyl-tRNA synthetase beta chain
MLVSYRWLSELLPDLNREPEEVAEALSAIGLAVDGITDLRTSLRPVVVCTVEGVDKHPTRPNLSLVTVRLHGGEGPVPPSGSLPPSREMRQSAPDLTTVVCGANNVPPPGGQVLYAGSGARLPGVDFVLAARDIGGVRSDGMLCSEAELGLANESDGIWTLPPGSFPAGSRLIDVFPEARDVLFEIDVTPNRPDALGHVGIARDLAAYFEIDFDVPEAGDADGTGPDIGLAISLANREPDRCPRYGAALVRGATVGPSPLFMRWRLHRLGVRPISNVVDVTNWVLLEFGQPLHAFDAALVRGGTIEVRLARADETITTLDGQVRSLAGDDLLITDGHGPTALAGIMGGKNSEIQADTRDVLLECAYFAPRGIRRTARRLGIHTESSHRFERGTDHACTDLVLARARALMCQLTGGVAAAGTLRADGPAIELPRIELRSDRIERLLGVPVPFKEAVRTLNRLGLAVEYLRDADHNVKHALVRGASHRPDVTIEQDLIEEIARIRGLDEIPTVLPAIEPQSPRSSGLMEREVANVAVALGLSEALTYSFVSAADLDKLHAPKPVVSLRNPLSEDRSVLRTSLLPGLLEAVARARRRGQKRAQLFTTGVVFLPVGTEHPYSSARPSTREDAAGLPYERPSWAAVLAGPRPEHLSLKPPDFDVYDAKAIAVEVVERLTGKKAQVEPAEPGKVQHLHPRSTGRVLVDGVDVGTFGPLHPEVVEAWDLGGGLQVIELDLGTIEALGKVTPRYRPVPRLPAVTRDLSLLILDETPASAVSQAIRAEAGELCESVEIASEFRGGSVPKGQRSITFRVVYRDPLARRSPDSARTLTDKEIDLIQEKVVARASKQFGATLRAS